MKLLPFAFVFAGSAGFRVLTQKRNCSEVELEQPFADAPDAPEDVRGVQFDGNETDVGKPGVGIVYPMTAPALGAKERSCLCRFGMYSYMTWPRDQAGGGCVGGCGGSEFQISRYGATIKELLVWTVSGSNSNIKAIRFMYHDGQTVTKGDSGGASGPWRFTFEAGEYVVGDFKLSGNGIGTRLGSIGFTTSSGRSFEVGMSSPQRYYFPSGNSYIAGFMGRSGSEIDLLGVIFWKPIDSVRYQSIRYPTLSSLPHLRSPHQMEQRSYCNPLPLHTEPISIPGDSWETKITMGRKACFDSSASFQWSSTVTVNGGIPAVKQVGVETRWEVSASLSISNCVDSSQEVRRNVTFPTMLVYPQTSFDYFWTHWKASLTAVPFEADLLITLNDGTTFQRSETGTYTGFDYNYIRSYPENYREGVTECR